MKRGGTRCSDGLVLPLPCSHYWSLRCSQAAAAALLPPHRADATRATGGPSRSGPLIRAQVAQGHSRPVKLKDIKASREYYAAKANEILRSLGYAAIGVAWVFRKQKDGATRLEEPLMWVCALVVVALLSDLVLYAYGSFRFKRRLDEVNELLDEKDERSNLEADVPDNPRRMLVPLQIAYFVKLWFVVIAYIVLLAYIGGELSK